MPTSTPSHSVPPSHCHVTRHTSWQRLEPISIMREQNQRSSRVFPTNHHLCLSFPGALVFLQPITYHVVSCMPSIGTTGIWLKDQHSLFPRSSSDIWQCQHSHGLTDTNQTWAMQMQNRSRDNALFRRESGVSTRGGWLSTIMAPWKIAVGRHPAAN